MLGAGNRRDARATNGMFLLGDGGFGELDVAAGGVIDADGFAEADLGGGRVFTEDDGFDFFFEGVVEFVAIGSK